MKFTIVLLSLLSFSAFAEKKMDVKNMTPEQKEMMTKMHEMAMPNESHKILSQLEGKWTFTSKMWESAEAKPQESKGTSVMKMILGGRFLQQEVSGKAMGMDYTGMGFMGYDTVQKQYTSMWMDTMSTAIMKGTGSYDEATKTLTEKGQYSSPMTESKMSDYRSEMKIIDKNNMTFSMYGKGLKGEKEFKMMEMTYKK